MFPNLVAAGILVLGFIIADWIQLNGFAYIVGMVYLAFLIPAFIREVIKLVRK